MPHTALRCSRSRARAAADKRLARHRDPQGRLLDPYHAAQTEAALCSFDSANDDELVCYRRQAGVDRSISFRRSDIELIRRRNATGSIIAGTVLGAGIGAGIGAIVDSGIKNPNTTDNAKFTGGLSRAGGVLGALFGIATEFVPGKLLYKSEIQRPEAGATR